MARRNWGQGPYGPEPPVVVLGKRDWRFLWLRRRRHVVDPSAGRENDFRIFYSTLEDVEQPTKEDE